MEASRHRAQPAHWMAGSVIWAAWMVCGVSAGAVEPAGTAQASAATHIEVEGVPFEGAATVAGTHLVLNGVGVRKRAFFKTEVVGLYLPQRSNSADAVLHGSGPRRLRVIMLRDAPALLAAKLFVSDFRRLATEAEFQLLRDEVNYASTLYESLPGMKAGDELIVDWVPGQGVVSRLNGKPWGKAINNELFFQIACLRPGLGADAPSDLRARLLGQVSMPTAPGAYPPARTADAAH